MPEIDMDKDIIGTDNQEFCQRAITESEKYGQGASVLLVGSRGAGYIVSWSDIDLWVLGDKRALNDTAAKEYALTRQIFVDRGDLEAHYTFYDLGDLRQRLQEWPDELLWLLQRSRILHDPLGRASELRTQFADYPEDIMQDKLRWQLCEYSQHQGRLGVAGRGMPVAAVMAAGRCIETACRICCLAERKPYPYLKWLRRAAGETRLGEIVCPVVDRAVEHIQELATPPEGVPYTDLIPLKELRSLKPTLCRELARIGWTGDWVENPGHYVWLLFSQ